jgi:hypothetical protein
MRDARLRGLRSVADRLAAEIEGLIDVIDWGADANDVVVASCDLENPESCESCQ